MTDDTDLRAAVRAYLATLPARERDSACEYGNACDAPATAAAVHGPLRCDEHARTLYATRPLPARVVALRALAAMVRE